MELVAASKMRRATGRVLSTRPYAGLCWQTVRAVAVVSDLSVHPLLRRSPQNNKILFLVYASDRGLCGGFNSRLFKVALKEIGAAKETPRDVVAIGKRATTAMRRAGLPILAAFENLTNNPRFEETLPIARLVLDGYEKGVYDQVVLFYTDYVSAVTQIPRRLILLPLTEEEQELGEENLQSRGLIFEPSPAAVLDFILPRLVETMIWQALLESAASEHSARMVAMRNATEAAAEMIDNLTFNFNQIRQAGITQEIAEISSGKAAIE